MMLLLLGCGASLPECSSKEVTDVVMKILEEQKIISLENYYLDKYDIQLIRTTSRSETECKCIGEVFGDGKSIREILYTVELMDNKEQFRVTVF